jgi:hypothetical protein
LLIEISNNINILKEQLSLLASICGEVKYFEFKNTIILYEIKFKRFKECYGSSVVLTENNQHSQPNQQQLKQQKLTATLARLRPQSVASVQLVGDMYDPNLNAQTAISNGSNENPNKRNRVNVLAERSNEMNANMNGESNYSCESCKLNQSIPQDRRRSNQSRSNFAGYAPRSYRNIEWSSNETAEEEEELQKQQIYMNTRKRPPISTSDKSTTTINDVSTQTDEDKSRENKLMLLYESGYSSPHHDDIMQRTLKQNLKRDKQMQKQQQQQQQKQPQVYTIKKTIAAASTVSAASSTSSPVQYIEHVASNHLVEEASKSSANSTSTPLPDDNKEKRKSNNDYYEPVVLRDQDLSYIDRVYISVNNGKMDNSRDDYIKPKNSSTLSSDMALNPESDGKKLLLEAYLRNNPSNAVASAADVVISSASTRSSSIVCEVNGDVANASILETGNSGASISGQDSRDAICHKRSPLNATSSVHSNTNSQENTNASSRTSNRTPNKIKLLRARNTENTITTTRESGIGTYNDDEIDSIRNDEDDEDENEQENKQEDERERVNEQEQEQEDDFFADFDLNAKSLNEKNPSAFSSEDSYDQNLIKKQRTAEQICFPKAKAKKQDKPKALSRATIRTIDAELSSASQASTDADSSWSSFIRKFLTFLLFLFPLLFFLFVYLFYLYFLNPSCCDFKRDYLFINIS